MTIIGMIAGHFRIIADIAIRSILNLSCCEHGSSSGVEWNM
jgi:hypothetical protein